MKPQNIYIIAAALLLTLSAQAKSTNNKSLLTKKIQSVIDTSKGHIGVAMYGLDFRDSFYILPHDHFPMLSVYKLPLAIKTLHMVDQGKLSLTQNIHIPKKELVTTTWGPLVKDYPDQDIDVKLEKLLMYAISYSDNNACDILFKLTGGTKATNNYMHSIGIKNIAIVATEAQMGANWNAIYTNWCEPVAMIQVLRKVYDGSVLSKTSNDFLLKIMTDSKSPKRIAALLPDGTIVAHKTGTSGTNEKGMSGATNDVGIVTLPNGKHYALVVFTSNYPGDQARGENMIGAISKAIWDYLTVQNK